MRSYVIHLLRAMPSQGTQEGRYVGRTQSPLAMRAVAELAGYKREYRYPQAEFFCASPAIASVDTLKTLYPQAQPEVILELAECDFGDWEGKTAADLGDDPRFAQWLAGQGAPPNGESGQVFFRRVCKGFQMLVENLLGRGIGESVLVAPAGVLTLILAGFGLPRAQPQDWLCDPGFGYSARITPTLWAREPVMEVFDRVPWPIEKSDKG
ncbi:histidine phosphatase family protein [Acutalibacter caecimuris]|uniref:histidine phosphatase family protein n=1 Tax=Acutalibacter caecimuris TaxID=3093657 RepID=UPI002AC8F74E|nr:histidine phosphatase family protein [Acutalibacter sp. M00118]